jgi:hypothetical protein
MVKQGEGGREGGLECGVIIEAQCSAVQSVRRLISQALFYCAVE